MPIDRANTSFVEFDRVQKSYDGVSLVVKDLNLTVAKGEFLTMLGPSGSGKTTCLMMLAGFETATNGEIRLDGRPINLVPPHKRGIGMVFQNYALFDFVDVGENVAFPLRQWGELDAGEITARVTRRLAQVNLSDAARKPTSALSGGMKKRVCLARATVHDPPVMLCDDPTAGLDPVTTNRIFALLAQLRAENSATTIIVSHEVGALRQACERVVLLERGQVVYDGAMAEAAESDHAGLRAFFDAGAAS